MGLKLFWKKEKVDGDFFKNSKTGQITYVIKKKKTPKRLLKKINKEVYN